jgi:hypothetical protein
MEGIVSKSKFAASVCVPQTPKVVRPDSDAEQTKSGFTHRIVSSKGQQVAEMLDSGHRQDLLRSGFGYHACWANDV